jgi:hypothetical protein
VPAAWKPLEFVVVSCNEITSLTASDTAWPAVVSEQEVPLPLAVAQLRLVADPFLNRVAVVWIAAFAE